MLLASVLLLTLAVLMASVTTNSQLAEIRPAHGLVNGQLSTAVLLGMGNSLFHVWGGKQTAIRSGNDIRALGVFVSTGAFGLAIGGVFASWFLLYAFLLGIGVLAVTALKFSTGNASYNDQYPHDMKYWEGVWYFIVLIMLIVAGRSFAGEAYTTGITKSTTLLLVLGAVSMLGKMAGGWLAKGLGIWKSLLLMVVGAIICFIGRNLHIAVMLTGIFLVNCTMPITLYWANTLIRGKEGLAFGLLAASLIPGYLLATLDLSAIRLWMDN